MTDWIGVLVTWYVFSVLGWMLVALLKYKRRKIQDYMWCLVWPFAIWWNHR